MSIFSFGEKKRKHTDTCLSIMYINQATFYSCLHAYKSVISMSK